MQESGLEGESSGSATSQNAKPKTGPLQVCAVLSSHALPISFRASTPHCIWYLAKCTYGLPYRTCWSHLLPRMLTQDSSPKTAVYMLLQANGHVDGHAAHNGISAFEQSRGDSPRADGLGRARRSSAHHARDGVSQLPGSRCTFRHAPCQSHQPAWCQAWQLIMP